jgi:hypothetical protein
MRFIIEKEEQETRCALCNENLLMGDQALLERGEYFCSDECATNMQLVEFARAEQVHKRTRAVWRGGSQQDPKGRLE